MHTDTDFKRLLHLRFYTFRSFRNRSSLIRQKAVCGEFVCGPFLWVGRWGIQGILGGGGSGGMGGFGEGQGDNGAVAGHEPTG